MGRDCGATPRAMVDTLTLAVPLPVASMFGFTAQVVAIAGKEQDKLTCETNPFSAETEIALVNVAFCPALTVSVGVLDEVTEKSGGGGSTVSVNVPVEIE